MNRRGFLARLLATAAVGVAHELDLDRLLWVPGQKTIVLPAASTFDRNDFVLREGLRILENNLAMIRSINREYATRFHAEDRIAIRYKREWDIQLTSSSRLA